MVSSKHEKSSTFLVSGDKAQVRCEGRQPSLGSVDQGRWPPPALLRTKSSGGRRGRGGTASRRGDQRS